MNKSEKKENKIKKANERRKKRKKVLKIILILYGIYFLLTLPIRIQQKLPSDIEKVSIYEKKTILKELEEQYPEEKFEVLGFIPDSDLTYTYLLIGSPGEYGHLMMREFFVRPINKPGEEFIVKYDYGYTPGTHIIMALEEICRVLMIPLAPKFYDKYMYDMNKVYFYPKFYNDYQVRSLRNDKSQNQEINLELSEYLKPKVRELFPNLDFNITCDVYRTESYNIDKFNISVKIVTEIEEYFKIDINQVYNNFKILLDEVDKYLVDKISNELYIGNIEIASYPTIKTKFDELKDLDSRTLYFYVKEFEEEYFGGCYTGDVNLYRIRKLEKDGSMKIIEDSFEAFVKNRDIFMKNCKENLMNKKFD